MSIKRRIFVGAAPALAAMLGPWRAACAQEGYPNKPIKFVAPFPPGGPLDAMARLIAPRMQESMGQPVVIENIGGAGGSIGIGRLSKMPGDGYSIGLGHTATFGMATHLFKNVGYDPVADFTPIGRICDYVNLLVVRADSPFRTTADLLAAARAKPGTINYGSAGNGASNHLSGVLFSMLAKVNMVHVPYRGSAAAMTDLLGGTLQFMFDAPNTSLPLLRSGKLRVLGTTGRTRHRLLPDVPTVGETVSGYEVIGWAGVVAPRGVPAPIQRRLAAELEKALAAPEVGERLLGLGMDVNYSGPEELARLVRRDLALWGPVIKESGASAD